MANNYLQSIKDAIGSLLGQPAVGGDAVQLLMDDHKRVKELFADFEKNDDSKVKKQIAATILLELTVHAKIEEELVYPLLKREGEVAEVNEALVEHHVVKFLMGEIGQMSPGDEQFDAKVKVLGELVAHHVKEEESEMLPKLREGDNDSNELGRRIAERKEALLQQFEKRPKMLTGTNGNGNGKAVPASRNGNSKTSAALKTSAPGSKKTKAAHKSSKARAASKSGTKRATSSKSAATKKSAGLKSATSKSATDRKPAAKKAAPLKSIRSTKTASPAAKKASSSKKKSARK